jgi:hypothetical protein
MASARAARRSPLDTVDKNLVQHLVEEGFDTWVLDLRTSIGLPSSGEEWTFDEVAFQDICAAIEKVYEATSCRVNVIAHCIGSAMFCMAALAGHLSRNGQSLVRAAVLSQVGPLLELPPLNRFRGYLASYLKTLLDFDRFNVRVNWMRATRSSTACCCVSVPRGRMARAPPENGSEHRTARGLLQSVQRDLRPAVRARQPERETLERFGNLIGHVNYRLTSRPSILRPCAGSRTTWAANAYVTFERIRDHFRFPVCFCTGRENDLFDVRTSRRSFDLLASIFWTDDLEKIWNDPSRTARTTRSTPMASIFGSSRSMATDNQDCMIGSRAHVDVFPQITAFLDQAPKEDPKVAEQLDVIRPARMGPIVGWLRLGQDGCPWVRLLFSPNSSRSEPLYAMTIVLQRGKPVPQHAKFHPLKQDAPTQALDVQLPSGHSQDCHVVVVTVHKEAFEGDPKSDVGKPREDDPFGEDLDRFPLGVSFPATAKNVEADPYADAVLACCKDLGIDLEPLSAGRRVCDARYATPVRRGDRQQRSVASRRKQQGRCCAVVLCARQLPVRRGGHRPRTGRPGFRQAARSACWQ